MSMQVARKSTTTAAEKYRPAPSELVCTGWILVDKKTGAFVSRIRREKPKTFANAGFEWKKVAVLDADAIDIPQDLQDFLDGKNDFYWRG